MEATNVTPKVKKESSLGMDENLAGALAYLFGFITGIIFFFGEKKSTFVRFHGMQSMLLTAALIVLGVVLFVFSAVSAFLPFVGLILTFLLGFAWLIIGLAYIVLWIFLMYKAYQGEMFQLPVIGKIAEKQKNL